MYVSRTKQLNPHMGSESRDIRVNSALPESIHKPDCNAVILDQIALKQFRIRCNVTSASANVPASFNPVAPKTSSPTLNRVTFGPTASTTPAKS